MGYPKNLITLHVGPWDVSVLVTWRVDKDKRSDMLISLDADAQEQGEGVVCRCCLIEQGPGATIYADRMSLYRDHCFEPLAQWMQDELLTSRFLSLNKDKGFWVAQLIRDVRVKSCQDDWLWQLATTPPVVPSG